MFNCSSLILDRFRPLLVLGCWPLRNHHWHSEGGLDNISRRSRPSKLNYCFSGPKYHKLGRWICQTNALAKSDMELLGLLDDYISNTLPILEGDYPLHSSCRVGSIFLAMTIRGRICPPREILAKLRAKWKEVFLLVDGMFVDLKVPISVKPIFVESTRWFRLATLLTVVYNSPKENIKLGWKLALFGGVSYQRLYLAVCEWS